MIIGILHLKISIYNNVMCGIIISDITIPKTAYRFVEKRGPDAVNNISYNGINFVHFLLHLTGEKILQPIISENIICIFNGEIYNYKEIFPNAKSDIESILYAYKREGISCIKNFDGEFTIVIFDFNTNELIISADIFHTKPLFYDIGDNIVIASYESTCQSIKKGNYTSIKPNEILLFDLDTRSIKKKFTIYEFDLEQKKNTYQDYIAAFEHSVLKRYPENSIPLITLSSGLDSGVIACCLNKYKKKALYFKILNYTKKVNYGAGEKAIQMVLFPMASIWVLYWGKVKLLAYLKNMIILLEYYFLE